MRALTDADSPRSARRHGAAPSDSNLARALALIVEGLVTSRSSLRAQLGVSASTASNLVRQLIDAGAVEEVAHDDSTGGRPAARLRAIQTGAVWMVAELGSSHVRLGFSSPAQRLSAIEEWPLAIEDGPGALISLLRERRDAFLEEAPENRVLSISLALPGPVSGITGDLISPARMPGWTDFPILQELRDGLELPAQVENDARAAILGEYIFRDESVPELLYVKAGTGIGASLISNGQIILGGAGVAGDITHVPAPGAAGRPCSCGRTGCLETIASGAAILSDLSAQGLDVSTVKDVIESAAGSHPAATAAIRTAGKQLGTVLSPLVNFLNPSAVVIGGAISNLDAYVAAVRSALYDSSLPMNTQFLIIERSLAGRDAALIGLSRIAQRAEPVSVQIH